MKAMRCPLCGSTISITNKAQAWHTGCLKRPQRGPAPEYQEVTDG